jgi:multiple sugar transport system substrate-binding protein
MTTRRAFLGAALGVSAAAAGLTACSGVAGSGGGGGNAAGDSAEILVNWWGGDDRAKRTQQVISLFGKAHSNVKVTASFSDFNSYFQKLNTQAAGGGLPDVIQLGGGYVPQYMRKGQLLELTKYVDDKTIDLSDVDKGQIEQGQVDGKLYAVTIGGNMPGLIYNKSMLERVGVEPPAADITWAAFAGYLRTLQAKLPAGVYAVDHLEGPLFTTWMRQRYPEEYTPENKVAYTEADVTEYLQYWQDLRAAGINITGQLEAAEIANSAANAAPIALGKAVFASQWTNYLGQFQILMKDQLAMTRLPSGGKQAGDFVQASQFFSVAATSKAPQVAAQFINFFIHDAEALKILGVERGVPASAAARGLVTPTLKPYDQVQVQFMSDYAAKARPKSQLDPDNSAAVGDALNRAEQSVALNHVSPAAAAKKFMSDAAKALTS